MGSSLGQLRFLPTADRPRRDIQGVRRFAGGIRWPPAYEEVDGKTTLVITVEPPRPGDPIWSARRDFQGAKGGTAVKNGTIYVRRSGMTTPATSEELEALQRRLVGAELLEVEVVWDTAPSPIVTARLEERKLEKWLEVEREELLRLPKATAPSVAQGPLHPLAQVFAQMASGMIRPEVLAATLDDHVRTSTVIAFGTQQV